MLDRPTPARSPAPSGGPDPAPAALPWTPTVVLALAVAVVAAGMVAGADALLTARVHAGTDNALRMSVLLPYLGVDGSYVLARALGVAGFVLAAFSVVLGLENGRRRAARMPVSPAASSLHRLVGLVVVMLVAAHATVPFTSAVAPYGGWRTALVPLGQPAVWGRRVSLAESAGIAALYLFALLGPTYYVLRGRARVWIAVHRLSDVAYGLAVVHTLFLGSDFLVAGPARVALLAVQVPVTVVLGRRLAASARRSRRPRLAYAGAALAVTASAAVAALAGLSAAGTPLGAFRL